MLIDPTYAEENKSIDISQLKTNGAENIINLTTNSNPYKSELVMNHPLNIFRKDKQTKENNEKIPHFYMKQFFTGLLGSAGLGFIGFMVGSKIKSECYGSPDVMEICFNNRNAIIGGSIGANVGSFVGVYGTALKYKQKGSFWGALAGGVVGGISGILLAKRTNGLSIILLPPITTTIGFHLKL